MSQNSPYNFGAPITNSAHIIRFIKIAVSSNVGSVINSHAEMPKLASTKILAGSSSGLLVARGLPNISI